MEEYPWLKQYDSGRRNLESEVRNGKTIDTTHEISLSFARYSPRIFVISWVFLTALAIILYKL